MEKKNIISIYKGGNKEDPTNHRPLSLTEVPMSESNQRYLDKASGRKQHNKPEGVWIQTRKIMYYESSVLLLKNNRYNTGKRRVGWLCFSGS